MLGLWTVLFLILAGCGGSGSSGFDVVAGSGSSGFDLEQLVIARVSSVDAPCEPLEGTTFCGPNDSSFLGENSPFSMDVKPQSGSDISCVIPTGLEVCELAVGLSYLRGFQPNTAFLLAVRYKGPFSSSWEIASSRFASSVSDQWGVVVPIRGLSTGAAGKVDLAVLVYTSTTTTPPLSGTVNALLSDFKADVAFVVTDITVTPKAP